ncbi:MAG: hypothetical protein HKN05_09040, partial [Rhizobiales bacterium]|nr:hypothetical protein [Hyphomicrobiales bacterium]
MAAKSANSAPASPVVLQQSLPTHHADVLTPAVVELVQRIGVQDARTYWIVAVAQAASGPVPSAAKVAQLTELALKMDTRLVGERSGTKPGSGQADAPIAPDEMAEAGVRANPAALNKAATEERNITVHRPKPQSGQAADVWNGARSNAQAPGATPSPSMEGGRSPVETVSPGPQQDADQGECPSSARVLRPMQPEQPAVSKVGSERAPRSSVQTSFSQNETGEIYQEPTEQTAINQAREFQPDGLMTTGCAGLVYLLPALNQLGLTPWLAENTTLHDCCFGHRLLQFLIQRCRMPRDDRAVEAFDAPAWAEALPARMAFCLPDAAWPFAASASADGSVVARLKGEPGWRVLMTADRRGLLACWRGRAPKQVRRLLTGRPVRRRSEI